MSKSSMTKEAVASFMFSKLLVTSGIYDVCASGVSALSNVDRCLD
jgi:hypothetical protein